MRLGHAGLVVRDARLRRRDSRPGAGLISLGLREYLPGLGEFISPDPLLVPYDPQNLNPYAYASDNPSTKSDVAWES
jgi:RHS repeat-associated protein